MTYIYVSPEDAIEGNEPHWDAIGSKPVHEWRNHVPDEVRAIWHTFDYRQRAALVRWAEELAGREHWD